MAPACGPRARTWRAMLDNLIENALNYSPAGHDVTTRGAAGDRLALVLAVSDEGPGIARRTRASGCSSASTAASGSRARRAPGWGWRWWRRWPARWGGEASLENREAAAEPAPRCGCPRPDACPTLTRQLDEALPGARLASSRMVRRRIIRNVALALAGLVAAVAIGLAANTISGDSVGLSAQPLSAGEALAPAAARTSDASRGAGSRTSRERRRGRGARAVVRRVRRPRPRRRRLVPAPAPATPAGDDHGGGVEPRRRRRRRQLRFELRSSGSGSSGVSDDDSDDSSGHGGGDDETDLRPRGVVDKVRPLVTRASQTHRADRPAHAVPPPRASRRCTRRHAPSKRVTGSGPERPSGDSPGGLALYACTPCKTSHTPSA